MMPASLILVAAQMLAVPGPGGMPDARVQHLPYRADQVVTLSISPGYAAVVELAPDEAIENVVVGNSAVWQITPNSSANRVIVKPLGDAASTNMIVLTDARRYVFLLDPARGPGQDVFVLRFSYPEVERPIATTAKPVATYRVRGTKSLLPSSMRDDGSRTTISWPEQTELPAIFSVGDGGKEAIVNGRMIGSDYVIEGTASRYIFRRGADQAVASRRIVRQPK